MDEREICSKCGDVMFPGDDFYDTPGGTYCPDCFDSIVNNIWKRCVGDTIERT
jgi:hypothetical protein